MNHIWRPLVEKAGYQMEDMPKTWDAFYDFFKDVQKKLRAKGVRNVYGLGFQMNTAGNDSNARANDFLIAYGGQDIVTKDGILHLDDPKVREAAIEMLTYPTTAYKEGYVPPGAINWNDADDNNAFHAQQIVMDIEGSLSGEVAIIKDEQANYHDIVTMPLALSNDGKPVPAQQGSLCGLIPKGAKNVALAKDFLKYLIQPKVLNEYLKTGLGRNMPAMPAIVKNDPWWLDPKDPHRAPYVRQGLFGSTVPTFWTSTPAYAQVQNEHVWQTAWPRSSRTRRRRRPRQRRRSSGSRRSSRNTRSRKTEPVRPPSLSKCSTRSRQCRPARSSTTSGCRPYWEQIKVQQAAYPARQQRGRGARQRPPNNLEAPGLPSKGRAPRHGAIAAPADRPQAGDHRAVARVGF